ncbi:serine hydrolase [Arenimonas composti]|uniref:Beta-lactamase n=1 Tax=Arenimonas composti TR7-09 = DSM 18010 TaxID=1121013 RepID=A0A091BW95_9GAMM|nr:serine hydrolase [Arenimonas composti]KFN48620.1 hypothetical protein P873_14065 [Arenimonas composti TR7-09 = DSM 18010]
MRRRLTTMVPLVFALLATAAARAEPPAMPAGDDPALRALVEQRFGGDRTGACVAVAVIADDVRTAHVCADPAEQARIEGDVAFEIGSVSKTMTAALLARWIAAGEASLDEPLSAWLPGTKVPEFEGQPILLRHVVTHTSGLPALPAGVPIPDPANPYAAMDVDGLLKAIEHAALTRAPGTTMEYSNFASMLLSIAVARRAGMPFDALMREELFTPLGMRTAHIGAPPAGVRAAVGHLPNRQPTSPWDFAADAAGVGGVRATLADMVAYVQAHLGQRPSALDPALALTREPVPTASGRPMAMNWMLGRLPGGTLHAHEGGTGGFSSFVGFDVAAGRGVVVLSDTALTSVGGLASLALHLVDPELPLGQPRKPATPPTELLDALAGRWRLSAGLAATIRHDGSRMFIHPDGQPEFELGYDSAGDFHPLAFDAVLRPVRQPGGGWGFQWQQGGAVMPAERVDPAAANGSAGGIAADAAPTVAELQAYAGEYPLAPQFALTVFERDGRLFIQGTGQQAIPAEPAARDVFVVPQVGAEFRFERDGDGRVTAVTLLQGGQAMRGERR